MRDSGMCLAHINCQEMMAIIIDSLTLLLKHCLPRKVIFYEGKDHALLLCFQGQASVRACAWWCGMSQQVKEAVANTSGWKRGDWFDATFMVK